MCDVLTCVLMCVHVCILCSDACLIRRKHTHVYACSWVWIHVCVYMCFYVCACSCVYIYSCVYTFACVNICLHVCACSCMHILMPVFMCIVLCACMCVSLIQFAFNWLNHLPRPLFKGFLPLGSISGHSLATGAIPVPWLGPSTKSPSLHVISGLFLWW